MISTRQLCVKLQNRDILRDVSVSFLGGLTYLVGQNGSGKTSLLRALLRQLEFEGEVEILGQDSRSFSTKKLAKQIAVVPQDLHIPFQIKVLDFVMMGRFPYLGWLGNYSQEDRAIAAQKLALLDLSEFSDRFLKQLSGGERQQVYLARALVQQAPILLLDEPGQSLDPKNKLKLYKMLAVLAAKGKTIICVTHDLEPLFEKGVRVVGLKAGEIVLDMDGEELDRERLMEIY